MWAQFNEVTPKKTQSFVNNLKEAAFNVLNTIRKTRQSSHNS